MYGIVAADALGAVNGASCETNNSTASTGTMNVSPVLYPNLEVSSLQVPPVIPSEALFNVTYVVTNTGTGQANGPWVDAISFGTVSNSTVLLTVTNSGNIPAHGSYSKQVSLTAPSCISGNFEVCVMPDQYLQVNSQACSPAAAECAPVQLQLSYPALQFLSFTKPQSVIGGVPFAVNWTVTNVGNATATGPWEDVVYIMGSPSPNPALGVPVATNIISGPLAPGATYNQAANVTLPPTQAGNYYVLFQTDAATNLQECAGRANNIVLSQVPLQVQPSFQWQGYRPQ